MIYNRDMTQPPYGQGPYNPAATPAPSMPPAYPNTPAPGYPPAFPPAYSPEAAIPVAPAYPPASPYALPQPAKKSPVLGWIGLGVVVVCGIIFFLCSKGLYDAVFDVMGTDWTTSGVLPDFSTLSTDQMNSIAGPTMGVFISGIIGLAGFIISIVATVQNKGRIFAIIGIILGVLAPFSFYLAMLVSASAHGVY